MDNTEFSMAGILASINLKRFLLHLALIEQFVTVTTTEQYEIKRYQ